ncbi:peptidyl-prolyl cis-trans isomerase [Candidatus Sumerlaeota bacterium]|nr:peptidyl-prolyl cis-trans isomerase [Candidatus Sumerlaeota bacterium]
MMKKRIVFIMSFAAVLLCVACLSAMDEVAIYANLFMDSPHFPKNSYTDPVAMTAELEFEKSAAKQYKDMIPKDVLSEIEKLLNERENALKIYFMKYRELSKHDYPENMFKSYYRDNIEKFSIPEKREFWYFFISSHIGPETQDWEKAQREKTKAELEILLKSQPMESLASQFDQEPYYANKSRKLGPFPRGRYPKDIEDVIFSLKEGEETPDFIETSKGFIRIKLLKIHPAKPYPYEEVENNIRRTVIAEEDLKVLSVMRESLFKKYGVSYKWEEWKDKTKEERDKEWDVLCDKLSMPRRFAPASPPNPFEDSVFELVLLKDFENLPESDIEIYEFMRTLVENRHLSMRGLEYASLKKATRDYTENELKDFYEKFPGHFYQKGIMEARMATFISPRKHKLEAISFNTPKDVADYFYSALIRGDSFEELAKTFSEDDYAKNGGYVGVVDEDKSRMGAIFDINAFDLKEGEFSKPLQRPGKGGYVIIKAEKVIREKKLLPFEQVKDKAREALIVTSQNEILVNMAKELFEAAKKDLSEDVKTRKKIILHGAVFNWF